MFRKNRDEASASALPVGLPDARKALAERYTIDAKEAESRADHAAEEEREREAEFQARRAAALQARREIAEPAHRPLAQAEVRREPESVPTRRDPVPAQPTAVVPAAVSEGAFPIYGWMQQATAEPDAKADWTRALLRAAVEEQREKASRV